MTAPDKPLHERIDERLSSDWTSNFRQQIEEDEALLREAAAELSRMRTALEWYQQEAEAIARYLSDKPPKTEAAVACMTVLSLDAGQRAAKALNQCAAIAERALTAGSGNE